ncbi:MAG: hypothetical protein ABI456_01010 [Ktedonobacteraceae bacterium]|nr:hypothetical protein [Chloroflexota bacterium]
MRHPSRLKVATITFVTIVTLISAFMLSSFALRGASVHAATGPKSNATRGTITPAGVVDPARFSTAKVASSSTSARPKGVRRIHQGSAASTSARAFNATSSTFDAEHAGKLLTSFNGVSSLDSAVTNFGAEFEPPDQGLCVGNGFVVEPVNSAFTIYRTNGAVVAGPFNVNALFNEGLTEFTSDPRCYFDKSTHTWFATILFISADNAASHFDISVNSSGDPTKAWTVYRVDTTNPNGNGCPCFGDQPLLGLDQDNIYVSTNEFSILGPQFNGAQIYAISKSELVALASSVNFVHFANLTIGGNLAASVQPATTYGHSDAEYFLNSLDPFGTFDNRLGVWAITDRGAVTSGGIPHLSHVLIQSEPYGVPPGAIQKGSTSLLDSGDDRMQQVQFINGDLWGALGTSVTIAHDTAARAGIAWFRVHPHLKGDTIGGAHIVHQGYVTSLGNYLTYPSIQASYEGTAAINFTLSGPTFFPSAGYVFLQEEHTAFGPIHISGKGRGSYDPTAGRWGDYSASVLAPSGKSFWMANEYIPPVTSQTPDGLRNWGTRVFEVSTGD